MKEKPSILLVEDSDDDALLFERVVAKSGLGIQTCRVHNGQEGIDYLLGLGEFSDRKPSLTCLPTIVMTSLEFERVGRRSYELGANSFTMKVKTTDSLSDRVEALRKWWFEHCTLFSPAELEGDPFAGDGSKAA